MKSKYSPLKSKHSSLRGSAATEAISKRDRHTRRERARGDDAGSIRTIAIIGLGLMGGSLAAALRKKMPRARIIGITRNRTALLTAKKKGWIHEGFRDVGRGIQNADFIVLCTPVHTFPALMAVLMTDAKGGAIVTDVGSVKGQIYKRMREAGRRDLHYVSAHPMVGSQASGIQAVNAALYDQGFTFLIRDKKASRDAYRKVRKFWRVLMPRVIEVTAEQHDRIVAAISHGPHALAVCLMLSASPEMLTYSAAGFRDMTRLAAGNPDIWLPIFRVNRKLTYQALETIVRQIRHFQELLKHRDTSGLRNILTQAAAKRSHIPQ